MSRPKSNTGKVQTCKCCAVMLSGSTSSQGSVFTKSRYFTHSGKRGADEWYCNICTPQNGTSVDHMCSRAAREHERHSVDHARNVVEAEMWWNPAPDVTAWNIPTVENSPLTVEEINNRESRLHVDNVRDMVPFWIRGVEAAEKGDVPKLEQFLEALETDSEAWFNTRSNDWAKPDQGWGSGAWDLGGDENQPVESQKVSGWDFIFETNAQNDNTRSNPSIDRLTHKKNTEDRRKQQIRGKKKFNLKKTHQGDSVYDFIEEIARQEAAGEERKLRMRAFFNMSTHEKIQKIHEVIHDLMAGP